MTRQNRARFLYRFRYHRHTDQGVSMRQADTQQSVTSDPGGSRTRDLRIKSLGHRTGNATPGNGWTLSDIGKSLSLCGLDRTANVYRFRYQSFSLVVLPLALTLAGRVAVMV
jgi:hypothetical protein